jgi:hypothetical protein
LKDRKKDIERHRMKMKDIERHGGKKKDRRKTLEGFWETHKERH